MDEIIKEFVEHLSNNDCSEILEIIFYGSSRYGTNDSTSDIDLLILTRDEPNSKGVVYIKGKKIEFHMKNIASLILEIDSLGENNDLSLLSIFFNGAPLLRKTDIFYDIQKELETQEIYPVKIRKRSNVKEFFERYKLSSGPIKSYFYHNTLEEIRKKYHEENGYSKIQTRKIKKLYEDRDYAESFYLANLPDEEFTENYLEAIAEENETLLDTLYDKISFTEGFDYPQYGNSRNNFIIFYATHVSSELEKLESFFKTEDTYYTHFYYTVLEKIRRLYANKKRINVRINSFPEEYEEEFLNKFYDCLNTIKLESICILFKYVVDEYKIDYSNYKVLEI